MKQALINIAVERTSTNINKVLPLTLFHGNDFLSGYAQSLRGLVPNGVELLSVSNEVSTGNVRFRFRDVVTLQIDDINLKCNELPMTTLIQNSIINPFYIKELGYQLDDTSLIPYQYLLNIEFFKGGVFGKSVTDSITPNQYRFDLQKLDDYIKIPLNYFVNGEIGINLFMTPKNNFTLNLSLNIEQ